MSGFKGKICIFFVAMVCVAVVGVPRARADNPVYNITLNTNGGNANPDYLRKICQMRNVGFSRPNADSTCPTTTASYSSSFSLSSSPVNEFPQKYANHVDATDGYETFLGYNNATRPGSIDYIDADGLMMSNPSGYNGNRAFYAWWGGVTGVTPFDVNYYSQAFNGTLVDTKSCTFGVNTGCDVLSPVGITPPAGKYFDGWFCRSTGAHNCRANRYLPSNYATLSTPITPLGSSAITNWPNTQMITSPYQTDLRDANGDIATNMSYEYTGQDTINLYAAWAPYNVTFACNPSSSSPYVGSATRTTSTYLDENNVVHDIVYGVDIPLAQNITNLCKSVYYRYDLTHGNDQWMPEYLNDLSGTSISSSIGSNLMMGESGSDNRTGVARIRQGQDVTIKVGASNPPSFSVEYNCGTFDGAAVQGAVPNQRYTLASNGVIIHPTRSESMVFRHYPRPALPYRQTNGEYLACSTYTLTPTSGAGAGVPQEFEDVILETANSTGYGCCHKPQYAEFKGYQVRRDNANGEILNNGELIQPGQFGAANCNVSFNNNTDPDTWQPGCELWPWKGQTYLTAVWEHTPITITLDNTDADNASNLLGTVYLKYGEYFYFISANTGEDMELEYLPNIPIRNGYTFGGYQYCDTNNNCTMIVDSNGEFISGANNLKFTDVDVTATIIWNRLYTASYSCGTDATGTAPTSDTVTYGTTPTLPSTAGSCAKTGYTLTGWRVDGESDNWVNGTSVWNFASDKNLTAQWTQVAILCPAGQYLEAGEMICSECIAGNYCPGGTYTFNETDDQGINICTGATYSGAGASSCIACPAGYDYNQTPGKTDITQCQIHCDAGTYVAVPGIVGYTQLEYIESTGTQWIDTGVSPTANFEIYLDGMIVSGGSGKVFGTSAGSIDVNTYSNTTLASGINGNFNSGGIGTGGIGNRFYIGLSPYWTLGYNGNKRNLERPYTPSGTLTLLATTSNSAHVTARIYEVKLYNNDALTFRGIPVRRNSDGAVGLYDTVSNRFVGNSGAGTFVAGPDVSNECINVGAGYWAAESTTNFGSVGTRTACPEGTYSNIPNASACTPCANATYNDEVAATMCKSCPPGYDYNTAPGKTDITQCQIHCDTGTWNGEYTQLEYIEGTGTQYIDTGYIPTILTRSEIDLKFTNDAFKSSGEASFFGVTNHSVNFGDTPYTVYTVFPWTCANGTSGCNVSSVNINSTLKTTRQTVVLDAKNKIVSYGDVQKGLSQTPGAPQGSVYLFGAHRIATNGTESVSVYSCNDGMFVYAARIYENNILVRNFVPVRRNSDGVLGMYDTVNNVFYTNAGTGTFIAGLDIGTIISGGCINVGAGYWAAESTTNFGSVGTRNACPEGLSTVGYGHGADSANDCAHVLHIDDKVLYARRDKITTPSLNIKVPNEDVCYISLSPTDHTLSRLHFLYEGNRYTAYDDSLFYGERDFDTGQQIINSGS